MMERQVSAKTTVIIATATLLLGMLATLAFTCAPQNGSPALPGLITRTVTQHDTVRRVVPKFIERRGDTIIVGICDSGCTPTIAPPKPVAQQWNFSSILPAVAAPLVAAFRPPTPRNFFEVWAKAGNDLFGGYGGAVMAYFNLDQIHVANVTVFGELGYLHGLYFMIGVLGKLWGWL